MIIFERITLRLLSPRSKECGLVCSSLRTISARRSQTSEVMEHNTQRNCEVLWFHFFFGIFTALIGLLNVHVPVLLNCYVLTYQIQTPFIYINRVVHFPPHQGGWPLPVVGSHVSNPGIKPWASFICTGWW